MIRSVLSRVVPRARRICNSVLVILMDYFFSKRQVSLTNCKYYSLNLSYNKLFTLGFFCVII